MVCFPLSVSLLASPSLVSRSAETKAFEGSVEAESQPHEVIFQGSFLSQFLSDMILSDGLMIQMPHILCFPQISLHNKFFTLLSFCGYTVADN